jgi:uncharacterized membrane protein YhaH (DUF805 family)
MTFPEFLFSIRGRVRRREFALFALVMGAVFLNWWAGMYDMAARAHVDTRTLTDGYMINLLTRSDTHYATLALLVLITYTVAAKRLHDRGRSGWWQVMVFVPVIGWGWLAVELFILPGSPGANRYGPHPTFGAPAEGETLRTGFRR